MQLWRERILFVLKYMKKIRPYTVLDLGCGNGKLISYINRTMPDINIYGLDKSSRQCRRLERKFSENNQIKIIKKDFLTDLFDFDKKIDVVLLIEVIEHLELSDVYYLLDKICNQIYPAFIFITTPNRSLNKYMNELTDHNFRNIDHKFELTNEEADIFIKKCREICWKYNVNKAYCSKNSASHYIIFERK